MRDPVAPRGIRLGIARGVSFGLFGPSERFAASLRDLGARLIRVFLYWSQIEPERGRRDWSVVDALLAQLSKEDEVWVTVCSSSPWATREATDFLPPSPANEAADYYRFVHALVARCRGRVRYWQCENEPSNVGLLWAGTAAEYREQLANFHRAVRDADPGALVVIGGCGHDVLSSPTGGEPRQFFDQVLATGGKCFDVFDVHLYGRPALIPSHIESVRAMMRKHGYEHPVVVGEYNGPTLFEFPELDGVLQETMAAALAGDGGGLSSMELAAHAGLETPERRAMRALYDAMPALPEALQMFMAGCPSELDQLRDRINCRQIIARNVLALSTGVTRTVCWQLAPEVGNYEDPLTMMELMHGKLALLRYDNGRLGRRRPAADTFRLLAGELEGAEAVTRIEHPEDPEILEFEVQRPARGPLAVIWREGDPLTGERRPPVPAELPWAHASAVAVDAFGASRRLDPSDGRIRLELSITPTLLAPAPAAPVT